MQGLWQGSGQFKTRHANRLGHVAQSVLSQYAVWLLARVGLLVFVAGRVIKMAKNNDDEPWGWKQFGSVLLMFLLVIGMLILTSDWLYK